MTCRPPAAPHGAILLIASLACTAASPLAADTFFTRIASVPVDGNLPAEKAPLEETSAEIIAVSADGETLVYSDSPLGGIGLIDIADPDAPSPAGFVALDGEPTAVTMLDGHALVALNTSSAYTEPSGELALVATDSGETLARCGLDGQPDSIALAPDASFLAVAIENERDEDLDDGALPQLPAGHVEIYPLIDGQPDCEARTVATLTGLAEVAPEDPEPEFVDINDAGEIVISLQENNHLVVLDGTTGEVLSHFSAGSVDLENVDLEEEGALTFDGVQSARVREPDAVQWLDEERFAAANEGDYEGGSRGFTIYSKAGEVLYESGLDLEYRIAMAGHYPEGRSGNKGVEPEGLEVATYDGERLIFVLAERASVVGVYRDTGAAPEFVQLLPTGIAPEGAVAIPARALLAVANEADLGADGGPRSHVTLYRRGAAAPAYPMLVSERDAEGRPIGWGALSGLAADPAIPGRLYAVNDSFYAMQPTIFTIDATATPARIVAATPVTRGGAAAQLLDLEGIAVDPDGGFWLASEGRHDRLVPHALYHVDADGAIDREIPFPPELLAVEQRWAAEGIAVDGSRLWVALQRPWQDDPEDTVKLLVHDLEEESWRAVGHRTEPVEEGWVGLSELSIVDGVAHVIERDNLVGEAARLKALYRIELDAVESVALGEPLPIVPKTHVHDFLPDLLATGGYAIDKLEGFAIDASGVAYAVTDNDGVDGSNGETLFFRVDLDDGAS